jgi:hypothetical protein
LASLIESRVVIDQAVITTGSSQGDLMMGIGEFLEIQVTCQQRIVTGRDEPLFRQIQDNPGVLKIVLVQRVIGGFHGFGDRSDRVKLGAVMGLNASWLFHHHWIDQRGRRSKLSGSGWNQRKGQTKGS